ncbi:4-hydroxy-tetrahydrodipicolinate reductase [Breznakiella homolactica]|uniref:4-hydroxy-tetrahydrodipicolinate reductase n=1 Tax=Breznakiella homolactica TaxID=2798577 RepID=A0A7T7XQS9_9SPIR|nr:4-hydroxy-tetrahydrodipicolinate reductase [Breznakiella homolactica]QQO10800.1 4-hydroxy-tetrahydrodipicolinate reductase [Breznakiella homolactica]
MNIAIIGYGKMGKMIESIALARGHSITAIADPFAAGGTGSSGAPIYGDIPGIAELADTDAAIEFTSPDTAFANVTALAERKVPAVVGTTGWLDRLGEAEEIVRKNGSSLLWASNFSLGVNLFYRIAAFAAQIMNPFPEYDGGIFEAHHNKKVDSPSGTAKTLAELVLSSMTRKTKAVYEALEHRAPAPEELHVGSLRVGSVPGTHTLIFDSPADTIEITHTARNREGLASGAVQAAEWLARETRRGIFTMDDVLEEIIGA